MTTSIRAGMCIQIQSARTGDWHPYVVITEPEGNPLEVAVVNFTGYKPNVDETAVFDVGDHPYLTKKSMINYMDGQVVSVDRLELFIEGNPHKVKADCDSKMLTKIQKGVSTSRATRPKFREYCEGRC